jgi:hypothetical protein
MSSSFHSIRSLPLLLCFSTGILGCASAPATNGTDAGAAADTSVPIADVSVPVADANLPVSGIVMISAATPTTRPTSGFGTSYWSWVPAWGNPVAGTESQVLALGPVVMRIGGYNNDANTPAVFDNTQIDLAIAYARAISAEPILQVPLLAADPTGTPANADTAAAIVTYANITKGYGIKYFSVGNEPDIYPDATGTTKGIVGYTPAAFCTSATAYVAAMKAADPTIQILGPELSWKYQTGTNDWLTPILQTCGALFDIVTIHRYPIDPAQTTIANAAADAAKLKGVIAHVRSIMDLAGVGNKPLAITEANITWDDTPAKSTMPASPGTVPAGLWAADTFGVELQNGLWATIFWSTCESWTLGLFAPPPPSGQPQPAYFAFDLYATHFGPTLLTVSSTPDGVHAYASRNQTATGTQLMVVNWNSATATLAFNIDGQLTPANFVIPALSMAAIDIPDLGTASALVYGEPQHQAGLPPQPLAAP